MPTPDATTTAAFNAFGISPSDIYALPQYVAGMAVHVLIWLLEAMGPFWLILSVISAFVGLFFAIVYLPRHKGQGH